MEVPGRHSGSAKSLLHTVHICQPSLLTTIGTFCASPGIRQHMRNVEILVTVTCIAKTTVATDNQSESFLCAEI